MKNVTNLASVSSLRHPSQRAAARRSTWSRRASGPRWGSTWRGTYRCGATRRRGRRSSCWEPGRSARRWLMPPRRSVC